jgi:predicted metal-dependent phosphoesterase TrpH
MFDLQSHSLHSDGELTAAQVVENAAAAGVRLLALSDHDTVDGVDEALAAGALHGVSVVPARELGFEVDPAPIEARKAAGKPVGRPHLAAAVLAHPANAERLAEEGHADVSSFIPAYLIQGKPGYVARTHPTVEEAIEWIHDAAGVAVWAHPFWDIKADDEVLAAIDRYR